MRFLNFWSNTCYIFQDLYYDVQWEIECLPVVLPKVKWYAMMKERYPAQLEFVSNFEVSAGIRELSEGIMKYEGELIQE